MPSLSPYTLRARTRDDKNQSGDLDWSTFKMQLVRSWHVKRGSDPGPSPVLDSRVPSPELWALNQNHQKRDLCIHHKGFRLSSIVWFYLYLFIHTYSDASWKRSEMVESNLLKSAPTSCSPLLGSRNFADETACFTSEVASASLDHCAPLATAFCASS